MDPDPFSLINCLTTLPKELFFSSFLTIINPFIIAIGLVTILALVCLFILISLEQALKSLESEELKEIQTEHIKTYKQLQQLFDTNQSVNALFALSKLISLLIALVSLLFILHGENFKPLTQLIIVLTNIALVGWVLPKFFMHNNIVWVVRGMNFTDAIFRLITPLAIRLSPIEPKLPQDDVSLEELKTALPDSETKTPSMANLNLYKKVLRFDKILIKNVMRPKKEIEGIKANYNFKEVLAKIESSSFSRLPVYDGNWDHILGIIHCKDLLPFTSEPKLEWNQFIRPIINVKPEDLAQSVLRIFQHSKNHMAIVRNAANEIVGIVTLEDITEEIIGEIEDE